MLFGIGLHKAQGDLTRGQGGAVGMQNPRNKQANHKERAGNRPQNPVQYRQASCQQRQHSQPRRANKGDVLLGP